MSLTNDDAKWRAVLARDARFDDAFVYGVRTTRVYCRASCPSKRPKRENVRFFANAGEAERAGLRACKRCSARDAKMIRLCRFIEGHLEDRLTLDALAREAGLSPYHVQRRFRREIGLSPRGYADACRMRALTQALRSGASVTRASVEAGYGSSSRVHERAGARLGVTLRAYREGSPAVEIGFAIGRTRLGLLLVAATARGVCQVAFGDTREELFAALRGEYPLATLVENGGRAREWSEAVRRFAGGLAADARAPVDIRATAFQRRVWDYLMTIPRGETRAYAEVAAALGQPSAARAVARACATNPVALVIPCHRVVRGDGSLAGYRWGVERKKELLEAERRGALK